MQNPDLKVSTMLSVFETKHENLFRRLKKLLDKPKAERNKTHIKQILKEAKNLRALLKKKADKQVKCPFCEKHFDVVIS